MVSTIKQFFLPSIYVAIFGLILAFFVGGPEAVIIAAILGVLEVSLSFDNAIVNAKILNTMQDVWKRRFLTWGMLIAVFGMRLVFPVLIVSVVAGITPWGAAVLAATDQIAYAEHLDAAKLAIKGFGGAFLAMVFLEYFLNEEKDVHWIHWIESPLTKLGKIETIHAALTLLFAYGISKILPAGGQMFFDAAFFGVITFVVTGALKTLVQKDEDGVEGPDVLATVVQTGFTTFIYLEVLDASFSFDGVIGAFALSTNMFIIAIGLGIGAMFVRSMTLLLVEKGTLAEYKFLEHSAFYAIGVLAAIMFIDTVHEVPETVTGLIGAVIIALGFYTSLRENKIVE